MQFVLNRMLRCVYSHVSLLSLHIRWKLEFNAACYLNYIYSVYSTYFLWFIVCMRFGKFWVTHNDLFFLNQLFCVCSLFSMPSYEKCAVHIKAAVSKWCRKRWCVVAFFSDWQWSWTWTMLICVMNLQSVSIMCSDSPKSKQIFIQMNRTSIVYLSYWICL